MVHTWRFVLTVWFRDHDCWLFDGELNDGLGDGKGSGAMGQTCDALCGAATKFPKLSK